MSKAIGIDLGTTYSCVGIWEKGQVKIIPNEQGNRKSPSFVSFSYNGRVVGDAAKNLAALNPWNTIFNVKRLMGRRFDDAGLQFDTKRFPYPVLNKSGKPYVQVEYRGQLKNCSPEEISAMILMKMKQVAESHLGTVVNDAVVTIPAYFNNSQRQATKDAGIISGLNILRLIPEPSAAALAYVLTKNIQGQRNILVFDLGGGTLDVSILIYDDGVLEVEAVAGDANLGGEDFDDRIVNHFVDEFRRKHRKDLLSDARALRRLRAACERAKRELSSATQTFIEIESLSQGIDFYTSFTRARFEGLCEDLFLSTLEPVEKVLHDAKLDKGSIDDVLLVGGSTRIPYIDKLLSGFFNGKEFNKSVNPDEAAAYGASALAALLSGDTSKKLMELLLFDVIPFPLRIQIAGSDSMPIIANSNTVIPAQKSLTFSTSADNQSSLYIQLYEEDLACTKDNILLGKFELHHIPPAPRGAPVVEITAHLDANCDISAGAVEKATGQASRLYVRNDQLRLPKEEVARLIEDFKKYEAEEKAATAGVAAKNTLEVYAYNLRTSINDARIQLEDAIDQTIAWLDSSQERSREEYDQKQRQLKAMTRQILSTVYNV